MDTSCIINCLANFSWWWIIKKNNHQQHIAKGVRGCKGVQRCARVFKGVQGFSRVCKGFQGCARVYKGAQGCTRVYKGVQGCTRVYKDARIVCVICSRHIPGIATVTCGTGSACSKQLVTEALKMLFDTIP